MFSHNSYLAFSRVVGFSGNPQEASVSSYSGFSISAKYSLKGFSCLVFIFLLINWFYFFCLFLWYCQRERERERERETVLMPLSSPSLPLNI
ncbi:MAG: hypothetical protein MRERV_94c002 [Mycoplasmataceae bacterium RV_VA103A]|nr:MAG: hypothetical protein MRERV_94c002 [Mycoplasmataceae bacterium RV_VA103A]